MSRTTPLTRLRLLGTAALLLVGAAGLAACGSDDEPSTGTTSETSPEDVKVPLDDVLAKLPTMVEGGQKAAEAAAKGDFDTASSEYDELHEVWEGIEGTVKDTDIDAYEAIETAQGLISDGADSKDADRVQQGADDQASAVDDFVDAHGS